MTALDEALLAFNRSTREMGLGGPVKIVQTDTDPGDMGEPRIVHDEYGNTIVFVPSYELWPRGDAVSDAAMEKLVAEAFEEEQIRQAVIVYRKDLAERVRRLREVESDSPRDAQKRAWNRCLLAVLLLIEPTDEETP